MGYRILADENVERATISYLRKFDHEIEWIGDVDELCLGAGDTAIADYASKHDRLILTQDDDFSLTLNPPKPQGCSFRRTKPFQREK